MRFQPLECGCIIGFSRWYAEQRPAAGTYHIRIPQIYTWVANKQCIHASCVCSPQNRTEVAWLFDRLGNDYQGQFAYFQIVQCCIWNGEDSQPAIRIFAVGYFLEDWAANGNHLGSDAVDFMRAKFRRRKKRPWFVPGRKRKLNLIVPFNEHQSISLALTFVVAQFYNVLDTWILWASNIQHFSK